MMDEPGCIRMAFCDKGLVETVILGEGRVFFGMAVHAYVGQETRDRDTLWAGMLFIHIGLTTKSNATTTSNHPPSSFFFFAALLSLLLTLLKSGGASIANSNLKSSTSLCNSSSQ